MGEAAGQLPVGVSLRAQRVSLGLEHLHGVRAGGETRRMSRAASSTNAAASLAGSPPCLPSMLCHADTVAAVRSA